MNELIAVVITKKKKPALHEHPEGLVTRVWPQVPELGGHPVMFVPPVQYLSTGHGRHWAMAEALAE